jgi:hypothetical protein
MAYGAPAYTPWEEDPLNPNALVSRPGLKPLGPRPVGGLMGPNPGFDPAQQTMPIDGSMGAGLPEVPAGPAVPALPRSMKQDDWISAPNPVLGDWSNALSRRDQIIKEKPLLHDKEYDMPTWQKALMTAANAAGAYVNAGRRTHVDLIDQKTLMRRPKFEQAMDMWETKGKAIDAELQGIQAKYGLQRQASQDDLAQRQFKRQQEVSQAQIEETLAQAEQRRKLANAPQKPFADRWGTINPETGEYFKPPAWAMPQPKAPPTPHNATAEDKWFTGTPEEKKSALEWKKATMRPRGEGTQGALTTLQTLNRQDKIDKKVEAIDEAERGKAVGPGGDRVPGLHEQAKKVGQLIAKAPPGAVPEDLVNQLNQIKQELEAGYKYKASVGAITQKEADSYIQGLHKDWKPWEKTEKPAVKPETKKTDTSSVAGAPKPPPAQPAAAQTAAPGPSAKETFEKVFQNETIPPIPAAQQPAKPPTPTGPAGPPRPRGGEYGAHNEPKVTIEFNGTKYMIPQSQVAAALAENKGARVVPAQ